MSVNERKKQILHAVIKDYVETAEPVGSRTLVKKYNLGVSPATIRNEMSDLEDLGYITQPHTSAGRIPSDQGYRYFVDHLMDKALPKPEEVKLIKSQLAQQMKEMDSLFRQSCRLLSKLSSYTAVMVKPRLNKGALERVKLVPVGETQVLLILINDSGMMFHQVLDLGYPVDAGRLSQYEQQLQQKLGGIDMEQMTRSLLNDIANSMSWHQQAMKQMVDLMDYALSLCSDEQMLINGTTNMLAQPEFKDVELVRTVMDAIEEGDVIKSAFSPGDKEGVDVVIGSEMADESINCCSMVKATYHVNGQPVGSIGLIGPTRMDYAKAISLVETISKELSQLLSQKRQ